MNKNDEIENSQGVLITKYRCLSFLCETKSSKHFHLKPTFLSFYLINAEKIMWRHFTILRVSCFLVA